MGSKHQAWLETAERAAELVGQTKDELKAELLGFFESLDITIGRGLLYFREKDPDGHWKPLLDILESVHNGHPVPHGFHINEEQYAGLLALALEHTETYGNREATEKSISMLLDLCIIYPANVQPLIVIAGLIWREYGIKPALQMYDSLMQYDEHPLIYFHGADCLWAAGKKERAKAAIERALTLCDAHAHFDPLKKEITAYKRRTFK